MTAKPSFTAILDVIKAIPSGTTVSYGEVARRAGFPGRARWVARILRDSDDPDLPWHRVLRSDGKIAFVVGSEAYVEQIRRLQAEGVLIRDGKQADRCRTGIDLDREIWG